MRRLQSVQVVVLRIGIGGVDDGAGDALGGVWPDRRAMLRPRGPPAPAMQRGPRRPRAPDWRPGPETAGSDARHPPGWQRRRGASVARPGGGTGPRDWRVRTRASKACASGQKSAKAACRFAGSSSWCQPSAAQAARSRTATTFSSVRRAADSSPDVGLAPSRCRRPDGMSVAGHERAPCHLTGEKRRAPARSAGCGPANAAHPHRPPGRLTRPPWHRCAYACRRDRGL